MERRRIRRGFVQRRHSPRVKVSRVPEDFRDRPRIRRRNEIGIAGTEYKKE